MAEQLLDRPQVGASLEQVRRGARAAADGGSAAAAAARSCRGDGRARRGRARRTRHARAPAVRRAASTTRHAASSPSGTSRSLPPLRRGRAPGRCRRPRGRAPRPRPSEARTSTSSMSAASRSRAARLRRRRPPPARPRRGGVSREAVGPCAAPARRRARVTARARGGRRPDRGEPPRNRRRRQTAARTSQLCGVRREAADVDVLEIEPLVLQPGSEIAQVGPVCAPRHLGRAGLARKRSIAAAVSTSTVSRPRPDACPMRLAFGACRVTACPSTASSIRRCSGAPRRLAAARGRRRAPPPGPAIVVANHDSLSDPFFLGAAFDRPLRFMAKSVSGRTGSWGACSTPSAPSRSNGDEDVAAVAAARCDRRGRHGGDVPAGHGSRRRRPSLAARCGAPRADDGRAVGPASRSWARPTRCDRGRSFPVSRVSASGSASHPRRTSNPDDPDHAGADGARSRRRRRVVQGVARAWDARSGTLTVVPGRRWEAFTSSEPPERPADPAVRKANFRRIVRLFRPLSPPRRLRADRPLGGARRRLAVPAARGPRHGDPGRPDVRHGDDRPPLSALVAGRSRPDRAGSSALADAPLEPGRAGGDARPSHLGVPAPAAPLARLLHARGQGEVQSRIANDIGGIENDRHVDSDVGAVHVTTVLATVVAMVLLDWRLAAFALAPALVRPADEAGRRAAEG